MRCPEWVVKFLPPNHRGDETYVKNQKNAEKNLKKIVPSLESKRWWVFLDWWWTCSFLPTVFFHRGGGGIEYRSKNRKKFRKTDGNGQSKGRTLSPFTKHFPAILSFFFLQFFPEIFPIFQIMFDSPVEANSWGVENFHHSFRTLHPSFSSNIYFF